MTNGKKYRKGYRDGKRVAELKLTAERKRRTIFEQGYQAGLEDNQPQVHARGYDEGYDKGSAESDRLQRRAFKEGYEAGYREAEKHATQSYQTGYEAAKAETHETCLQPGSDEVAQMAAGAYLRGFADGQHTAAGPNMIVLTRSDYAQWVEGFAAAVERLRDPLQTDVGAPIAVDSLKIEERASDDMFWKLRTIHRELLHDLGREPTLAELAKEMDIPVEEVRKMLRSLGLIE